MARLIRKTVRGHTYWYAVESKRVNGKPRVIWQRYLGKLDDIIARCTQGPAAYDVLVYEFGAVAALLAIAQRLDLEGIIARHLPQGRQQVPVARYLLLASLNRVLAPCSKVQIGRWYEKTVLRRLWGLPANHFSSQRFWEAMDRLDAPTLAAIEEDLARAAVRNFGVQVQGLIYDATNFFTYISTTNAAALPQRGHQKQKRNDLKQVNLALLASEDGHVPLLHEPYPGNVPDSKEFATVYRRLVQRCRALAGDAAPELTLVFDKGNNSEANLARVAREGLHFVSSLVPSQHKDILAVPLATYREANPERWPKLLSYRTTKQVYGAERVVLATFNPALWAGQMQGLNAQRAKIETALTALQAKLARWRQVPRPKGKRPTPESVARVIARILRHREPGPFLRYTVAAAADGSLDLHFAWDDAALQAMIDQHFGKTLLFSDRTDWSDAQLIAAYRSQAKIEDAFRQWKDTHFVSWRPLLHWTDQKVRVHAAYCVYALLLSALLLREVRQSGIPTGLNGLLQTLAGIQAVVDLPHDDTRRRSLPVSIRLTRREPEQQHLFELLGLQRFHPEVAAANKTGTTA